MSKYHWDLYAIRNNMIQLTRLLDQTTDESQKVIISETIIQYQNMLSNIADTRKFKDIENGNIILDECMQEFMEYLTLSDEKFINLILETFNLIKDFKIKSGYDYLITFNNEQLLETCDNFMKTTLPPALFNKYQKEILDNPRHLHIRSSFDNSNGVTFIDPILKKKYILINRRNDITDLYVPVHEYFHFIFNDYNSYFASGKPMYHSQEIEGSLANLLFAEYFRNCSNADNKPNYDIARQLDESFLYYYQLRTISLVILTDYLEATDENGRFRQNKFNKFLNYFGFKTPLSNQELDEYVGSETADCAITYNLSFLAALDLFYIYKNDPEFAFYLLENIRFIKNDNDMLNVFRRNHITFMDDNFENFKKYIKKTERL